MDRILLFSGGRDSFLTACHLVELGDTVYILTCDPGCVTGLDNVPHSVKRLQEKYGVDKIKDADALSTVWIKNTFNSIWKRQPISKLNEICPDVTLNQAQCFLCQTAMWLKAIAYSKVKSITSIACGYRSSDLFCTGSDAYSDFIIHLCKDFNRTTYYPIWDMDFCKNNMNIRNQELIRRGFCPTMLEPKCIDGLPTIKKIDESVVKQLVAWFKDSVEYHSIVTSEVTFMQSQKITHDSHIGRYI